VCEKEKRILAKGIGAAASIRTAVLSLMKWWIIFVVGVLGAAAALLGCAAPAPAPAEPAAQTETASQQELPPQYAGETELIKPEECGKCHSRFYNLIKTEGGKHRIACTKCHVKFHIYRPGKVDYQDILPKCSACHKLVHGEDLAQCSECHTDAHAPMKIPAERALAESCYICHPDEDKEMKTYITQHTELYCSACHHTRHGYVPECLECHRPHSEGMTQAECLACHPPHKVLQVAYPEDIPQQACAGCHQDAYNKLNQTRTKHSSLPCAKCHPTHGAIITCRECHSEVHAERPDMLEKFRSCGRCHGAAHSVLH
jgi:hypothetical protein